MQEPWRCCAKDPFLLFSLYAGGTYGRGRGELYHNVIAGQDAFDGASEEGGEGHRSVCEASSDEMLVDQERACVMHPGS